MSGLNNNNNTEIYSYRLPTQSPECVTHLSIHRETSQERPSSVGGSGLDSSIALDSRAGSLIRWSSVERNPTPTGSVQIQPLEVHYTRDGQRLVAEHGTKMTVDGDAYTLVILECAPVQQQTTANGSATGDCDCHSRCFCQTELIVRQKMVPSDHVCQHSCQQHQYQPLEQQYQQYQQPLLAIERPASRNEQVTRVTHSSQGSEFKPSEYQNSSTVTNEQSCSWQRQQQPQQQGLCHQSGHNELIYPSRSPKPGQPNQYNSNNTTTTTTTTEYYDQQQQAPPSSYQQPQQSYKQPQYQRQPQQKTTPQYLHPQQAYNKQQQPASNQHTTQETIRREHIAKQVRNSPLQPNQQQNNFYRQKDLQDCSGQTNTTTTTNVNYWDSPSPNQQRQLDQLSSPQQQQQQQQSSLSPQQSSTRHHQQQSPEHQQLWLQPQSSQQQPKGKTRFVKKWDWNQAQFITVEVPERLAPKIAQSRPSTSPSFDVWNQDIIIQPSTSANLTSGPPPTTSSSSSQQQQQPQYDPSWLVYRVPDMDSVQSDPLYRDLLFELQRLEEGVKVREEPTVETETFQRPVFGQSITPEHIEVKEYETIEFFCRLIPNSDPNIKIEWTVNGKPLQESNRYTNEYDFGVVRLRIKRCEAEDSGIYQCKATNSVGEAITTGSLRVHAKGNIQCESLNPAGLDKIRQLENPKPVDHVEEQSIQQPPKFLTHITDYIEKDEGESVHFECCLAPVDDPDLKTEWFFNGRPLVTGSRFHTIDDFGFIVLDIDWLFPRDTGEYVCRATNKYGTDITRTVLRVRPDKNIVLDSQLDNPMIIDKLRQLEFPDVVHEIITEEPDKPAHFVKQLCSDGNRRQFIEGDNVHFEARVGPATDGNLTVEWYHNDKPLISGHRFKPTFDFGHIQLDILYVYAEDSGVYKCVTRNATGMDVSEFEIHVTEKPSLVYQSQLPKEMVGGVQKINEMEAMWNRAPDPEEEEPPAKRSGPEFVLKPKPCTAFEGSVARFNCQIIANPRPRITWVVNGQTVVTGSRYKLTSDGMYHLTIPKCQLSDAGKVEVYARNPLGECFATTELKVKRKVDDYRGVLKNSPNPWYDEQSLKMYQRQRSQDLTDDDDFYAFQTAAKLQYAAEQQNSSPIGNQLIGYMEPGTPDVNLLARPYPPLMEPGDLHPVVAEQQVIMAPAPSTIKRALDTKDSIRQPEKSFHSPQDSLLTQRRLSDQRQQDSDAGAGRQDLTQRQDQQHEQQQHQQQQQQRQQTQTNDKRVFGVDLPRYSAQKGGAGKQQWQPHQEQQRLARSPVQMSLQEAQSYQQQESGKYKYQQQQQLQRQQLQQVFDPRLPPPSPESMTHGKEVTAHTHKQTQLERRANKEIVREIIEKEIFEQEHKGVTKENVVRGSSVDRSSVERGSTPGSESGSLRETEASRRRQLQLQQQLQQQQQGQRRIHFQEQQQQNQQHVTIEQQQVFVEDYMVPPEFIQKIQPCQAIDGDEARFECSFKGDPRPTITWFRESKMLKPSNLYNIITNLETNTSTLVIKRVALDSSAVYTVKAENAAGSAKSSANLVVDPHPLPESSKGGMARKIETFSSQQIEMHAPNAEVGGQSSSMVATTGGSSSSYTTTTTTTTTSKAGNRSQLSSQQLQQQQLQKAALAAAMAASDSSQSDSLSRSGKVKSVRTRKLSNDEMTALIRTSPEGLVAPSFLHTIHDTTSKLGDVARLDARLLGSSPMDVRWLKDGQRVRADRNHKMVLEGDLYTLLIIECSPKDEGTYECIATNRVGEARCLAHLMLAQTNDGTTASYSSEAHRLAARSMTPELISTQSYSTTTSADYQQQQHHYLQQQQQALVGSYSGSSQQQQQKEQKQHYGAQRHKFGPMMSQYTPNLTIQNQPQPQIPKLIKRLENQQVQEGKTVTLRCQISSFPIAEVHWYKHGDKLIKPSKYFRIFKDNDETYCLKILETFPEDQGEYKCVARAPNGHTYVETKAMITVIPN